MEMTQYCGSAVGGVALVAQPQLRSTDHFGGRDLPAGPRDLMHPVSVTLSWALFLGVVKLRLGKLSPTNLTHRIT